MMEFEDETRLLVDGREYTPAEAWEKFVGGSTTADAFYERWTAGPPADARDAALRFVDEETAFWSTDRENLVDLLTEYVEDNADPRVAGVELDEEALKELDAGDADRIFVVVKFTWKITDAQISDIDATGAVDDALTNLGRNPDDYEWVPSDQIDMEAHEYEYRLRRARA